jgi:hypothetical protein
MHFVKKNLYFSHSYVYVFFPSFFSVWFPLYIFLFVFFLFFYLFISSRSFHGQHLDEPLDFVTFHCLDLNRKYCLHMEAHFYFVLFYVLMNLQPQSNGFL